MFMFKGKLQWFKYAKNEMFTIVFPTIFEIDEPVCALWQWSVNGKGVKKANEASVEPISSVSRKKGEVRVGFTVGDYYEFDVLVGPWLESLTVTMSVPKGDKVTTVLSRIYPKERPDQKVPHYNGPVPEGLGCSIYTGKLNWLKHAVNEMFTLIFMQEPGTPLQAGVPLYLGWQWTRDNKGTKRVNVTLFGELESATPHADTSQLKIKFLSDNYYKFEGFIDETGETMILVMIDPSGTRSPDNVLQLSYATIPSKRRRQKRGFLSGVTSTVTNDTDEALWCSLVQSGSAGDRKNLALGLVGEGLALIGTAMAVPAAGVPAAAGFAFSFVGLTFSTLTLIDGLRTPPDPTKGLLFPGDNMSRTSATLSLYTNNDLIITRTKVDLSSNALTIEFGVQKELEWKVSEIMSSNDVNFENLFSFYLPRDTRYRVESCTLIRVSGLKPNASGTSIPDELQPNISDAPSGTMFTTEAGTGSFTHGVWNAGTTSLRYYHPNLKFWYLESVFKDSRPDMKVIHLPNSASVIFQLEKCNIQKSPKGVAIGNCSYMADALLAIQEKMKQEPCAAYMWYSGSNQPVMAYKNLNDRCVIESGARYNRNYVWLQVEGYSYFQRITRT